MLDNQSTQEAIQTAADDENTVGVCVRCRCKAEGDEKAAGFVCNSCDDEDGDITGEANRIDSMPDVIITGHWKDSTDIFIHRCKIGDEVDELTDDEEDSDTDIFFYFSSVSNIKFGAGDFVVTSYEHEGKTVELTAEQIQAQKNNMLFEVFCERYKPISNPNPESTCFEQDGISYGFETYDEDLAAVKSADPRCVWTVMDSEINSGSVLVNGFRLCNRIHYIITSVPWNEGDDFVIHVS